MQAYRVFACVAVVCDCLTVTSSIRASEEKMDLATHAASASKTAASPHARPAKPYPKFEDVVKDMVPQKGLFTLWSYPADAKDKDKQKLLCQIPKSFLGEDFMLSVSFSGGGFFTGFPLEERVVEWELLDRQLVLVAPETRFVVDAKDTVSDVVRRTYPERLRTAVSLVTKSPAGDPLIDLGVMLKGNFADIAWTTFGRGGGIRADLSKWTEKKAFELNVEIGVELAMRRKSPPGSYDKKIVHFSFWKLPKTGYKPRVADDRVGYFVTANRDWAKPIEARDIFNRYIDRWQLVKRDPELAMCEPQEPIIFYIEKTVPVRFRRAVRDGILEWNRAFERIGFVNAIEVRQQTDDNEWKDLDPEDMRYSFFRWIVTGSSFAMGPHRANPFTGQIYDADIVFDDSMVRFFEQRAETLLPQAALTLKMHDPALEAFLDRHPEWEPSLRILEAFKAEEGREQVATDVIRRRMLQRGQVGCDFAEGMKHQLALAHSVLADAPKEATDRLLYDVVKETVAHEVGHTLGLRHNFKASSVYTLEEIRRRRKTDEPTCGSVMDYNPILFFADEPLEGRFSTPTLGPYDYWAIEYGYRPVESKPVRAEKVEMPARATSTLEKPKPEESPAPGPQADGAMLIEGKEIPKDVLDQLPPEAVKLLAERAASAPAPEQPTPAAPAAAPEFTGPNAKELKMLHKIASRAAEPELAYATDEDTTLYGPDPNSNRWDMGSDPVEWAKERINVVNRRLANVLDWAVKQGESWYLLRQSFVTLMFEKTVVLDYVGRSIGGQHMARSHRGDPQEPPPLQLVDPRLQRKALTFIEQNLFRDDFFAVSPEVLNHLIAPRWRHTGTSVGYAVDFPIHNFISFLQWWHLFDRMFPAGLVRLQDAELQTTAADKFTVAEYLQRMQAACWSDTAPQRVKEGTWTDAAPFVSSVRRSLQREYLNLAEPLVRLKPGLVLPPDLHAMVQHSLRRLADQLGRTAATGKLDFASEAHVVSCKSRIERMLAPELEEYGGRGR
ncbi:MAG: zinc-dependent metalloprotease [Phycisphaerae bacterium]